MQEVRVRSGFVDFPWGQVHIRGIQEDSGKPPVLLLHQNPLSSVTYERVLAPLAEKFRPIAVDTPGFGFSDSPGGPWKIGDYAKILHEVGQRLGMDRPMVVGQHTGACLAIETGPEPPYVLKRLIETVGSDAIRLNWDPANLILWPARYAKDAGEEYDRQKWMDLYQPVEGLDIVGEYVVHVHAKDALVHEDGQRQEVPFGEGWVDWDQFISKLRDDHNYDGYFAIEREVGENPVKDIQTAVDFLKNFSG